MRKVLLNTLVFLVVVSMAQLAPVQVQAGGQGAQGAGGQAAGGQRGTPYKGKAMPANTPGATFAVIRSGELAQVVAQQRGDTPVRVVGAPDGNYGAYVLTYYPQAPQPNAPINGTYHTDVAEIYYVINGTGTMAVGGELENATESDPESNGSKTVTGPSAGGSLVKHTLVRYEPGTIIFVPAGVPHFAGYDVLTKTDYLIIRVDPKRKINLK